MKNVLTKNIFGKDSKWLLTSSIVNRKKLGRNVAIEKQGKLIYF
ncbi:hypothetical protein OENI_20191 [Oenococcus oeni]|uniref:Uncharacterized protein n=1 Tax=Oenococcus oeni TaxID=1247 RepID=A0AAQ2ZDV6_OENOE|nr:hypothetical protein OENI_20191 [Oenococcus oeni]SYW04933.1 hypothetical protein OENI_110007 [Oenococcus oeni]SYW07881.1 hypothetical protein OENI_130010 [Oenococcus oeni]SYW10271.1 hypothetical protein OENI_20135 [Oenococcus oeni]SYW12395.1 hypothetical protein OENI_30032 [Oenococcus oeni]